jgi:hypothetical protein
MIQTPRNRVVLQWLTAETVTAHETALQLLAAHG